jgi:hypothetical protein
MNFLTFTADDNPDSILEKVSEFLGKLKAEKRLPEGLSKALVPINFETAKRPFKVLLAAELNVFGEFEFADSNRVALERCLLAQKAIWN